MRRSLVACLIGVSLVATGVGPAEAGVSKSRSPVLAEGVETGWSQLFRSDDGLNATVHTSGLEPGGAYTIWWVVVGEEGPVYVNRFAGFIVPPNGKATQHGSVAVGTLGIDISEPLGSPDPVYLGELTPEALSMTVEFHVFNHGQAADAADPSEWIQDFWTGDPDVCDILEPGGPPFEVCEFQQISVHE